MNQLIEDFIHYFYMNDGAAIGPAEALESANSIGVDSVDSLVDFLLSPNGGYNHIIFNTRKRRRFFTLNPQYAEINEKLEQRKAELMEDVENIRGDPSRNIQLSLLLSINHRDMPVTSNSGVVVPSLNSISGNGYSTMDPFEEVPKDVPIYTIDLTSETEMQLKFFGESPMFKKDGKTVYFREYIHRVRRNLERMGTPKIRFYRAILNSSGSPILAYDHGNDLILDIPEFKGNNGKVFWAQNSHSTRAIFYVDDEDVVHEYKGARLDLLSEFLVPTLTPPGVCSIGAVQTEAKTVVALSDLLPYRARAIDLDYRVPIMSVDNLDETANLDLGVLKREGKLHEFAPHLRMRNLEFVSYASLLSDYNFDFTKSFWNLGRQLGTAHSRQIYPKFMNVDNADVYGNMIDLEGTITNERFWKLFSEWSSKNILFADGNPLIRPIFLDYEFGDNFKPTPKIKQDDDDLGVPKDWNELRDLVNKYGIQIHELDSLLYTLSSVSYLLSRFENNPVLKGKQNEFYNAFFDGYKQGHGNGLIHPLMEEANKIIPGRPEWSKFDEFRDLIIYISGRDNTIPYVHIPRDFQFVDRNPVEVSSK